MIQKMLDFLTSIQTKDSPDQILTASSYLINELQAQDAGISEKARCLWNQLILSTTYMHDIYRLNDASVINSLLNDLKIELSMSSISDSPKYRIKDCFTPYKETVIGRDELFSQIHTQLQLTDSPLFLHGMAGIGKSVLAKAYATRYRESYDQILFATYETDLLELITNDQKITISGLQFRPCGKHGERGRYFRQKLKILKSLVSFRTLLIIDNFDVLKDAHLKDIASLPCKILFTTRTSPQVFGADGIEIPPLPDTNALRELFFLYAPGYSYRHEEWINIDKLIDSVYGHTLTVKLLAAQLSQETISINNLTFDSQNLMEQITQLFRLAKLSKEERTVLRYLSIMPLSGIPLQQFSEYCHFTKLNIIEKLAERNMIDFNSVTKIISLHPLLGQIIRKTELPDFANCRPYALTMCELGRNTWWNTSEEMNQYRDYFYTFMRYVDKPDTKLMDNIIYLVDGCWQLGNFPLAIEYGLKLHEYCMNNFGKQHVMTARIRHSIGTIYYNWGKTKKASEWYILGYENYKYTSEPDVYFYGILLMKAGRSMRYEKHFTESEYYLHKALNFLQEHLDTSSHLSENKPPKDGWIVLFFDILSEMSLLYQDFKKYDDAWHWCEKYMTHYKSLAFQHESMLWKPYYAMGSIKAKQNEYSEAENYLEAGLSIAEKYHKDNAVINLMILETLESIINDKSKKKELQKKIRKYKTL